METDAGGAHKPAFTHLSILYVHTYITLISWKKGKLMTFLYHVTYRLFVVLRCCVFNIMVFKLFFWDNHFILFFFSFFVFFNFWLKELSYDCVFSQMRTNTGWKRTAALEYDGGARYFVVYHCFIFLSWTCSAETKCTLTCQASAVGRQSLYICEYPSSTLYL